ncbi:hypothetical protein [Streptomyces sp. NPDC089919]|uniref:hypothetical protein n=1 Tax=Streptomyces sp. NPDC089919 TaxID=3155188 RepID=UPI003445342B
MSRRPPGTPPPAPLWPEVLIAYAMPAVTAGAGGIAGGQPQLVAAAFTTIGGTSALVTAVLGAALRRRPVRTRPARSSRVLLTAVAGLAGAVAGLAAGLAGAHWLPQVPFLADSPWPGRLPADLALSAALAAAITLWRRHGRPGRARPRLGVPARPERTSS